jgi:CDGSH-type Zn-finger protein
MKEATVSEEKPSIDVPATGPFLVKNLTKLTDANNQPVEMAKEVIALCRCGASKNKPFCDGTHSDIGFSGAKERQETYPEKTFKGAELTVIDNVGVCCHAGACVHGAPSAFFRWEGDERISEPDNEEKQKIIDTIRQCPSGSLAYLLNDELRDEFFSEPEIFISEDGPLHVRGGVELNDDDKPVSNNHYTLCRCGASKNKPYCDGAHKDAGFKG